MIRFISGVVLGIVLVLIGMSFSAADFPVWFVDTIFVIGLFGRALIDGELPAWIILGAFLSFGLIGLSIGAWIARRQA